MAQDEEQLRSRLNNSVRALRAHQGDRTMLWAQAQYLRHAISSIRQDRKATPLIGDVDNRNKISKNEYGQIIFSAHPNATDKDGEKVVALPPNQQLPEGNSLFVSDGYRTAEDSFACFAAAPNHKDSQGRLFFV